MEFKSGHIALTLCTGNKMIYTMYIFQCTFFTYGENTVVYRLYGSLYFIALMDQSEVILINIWCAINNSRFSLSIPVILSSSPLLTYHPKYCLFVHA